jgi:hypothetical protein
LVTGKIRKGFTSSSRSTSTIWETSSISTKSA